MSENKLSGNSEVSGDPPGGLILQDDVGYYKTVTKEREIPRKTYLSGFLRGKYEGEIAGNKDGHTTLYNFRIYEADVRHENAGTCSCITPLKQECNGLHTEAEGEFDLSAHFDWFPEKLPQPLPARVAKQGKEYVLHIYEPQLANVRFRLHQTEGKEVFGTIEADIIGFLLDLEVVVCTERVYFREVNSEKEAPVEVITRQLIKSLFPQAQ